MNQERKVGPPGGRTFDTIAGVVVIVLGCMFLWTCMIKPDLEPKAPPVRSQADQDGIWMLKAQEDVRKSLKDGDSAKFEGVFVHRYQGAPLVCGKVNSKNSFGGFTGFQRFIYMGETMPVVMEENMAAGEFPKTWNTFCAG